MDDYREDLEQEDGPNLEVVLRRAEYTKLASAFKLISDLGFIYAGFSMWRQPSLLLKCPDCGFKRPSVQTYVEDRDKWLVRCGNCYCRTPAYKNPMQAIKAWNDHNLTQISEMMIHRRDKDEPES